MDKIRQAARSFEFAVFHDSLAPSAEIYKEANINVENAESEDQSGEDVSGVGKRGEEGESDF